MQDTIVKYRKPIIATLIIVALLLAAWAITYSVFIFHVTSTSPSLDRVSDQAPYIDVTFNKPVDASSVLIASNDVSVSSSVSGKTLRINLLELMSAQKTYTIKIGQVSSTSKDVIKNYMLVFTPANNDSYLTPDQQTTILNLQDSHKSAVLNDPIFQYVPYSTLDYSLDGVVNSNNSVTITITIQLSSADVSSGRDAAVAQYTQEAMTYLQGLKGITLSNYTVTTNVIDPTT